MQATDVAASPLYLESLVGKVRGWDDPVARLEEAFAHDEFLLFGQSIIPLDGTKQLPFRLEILVRLHEEEAYSIPPGTFIPALEACGMMPALDRWVVERAAKWWQARGGVANTVLSINLTPETLDSADFAGHVAGRLRDAQMPPATICFEVAVEDVVGASARALETIAQLKALGCGLALANFDRDGFSLDAMKTIGAGVVKVSGARVREIHEDAAACAWLRSIQRVCAKANVRTVAQFVERRDSLGRLREMGVDYVQGYAVAKPAPLSRAA